MLFSANPFDMFWDISTIPQHLKMTNKEATHRLTDHNAVSPGRLVGMGEKSVNDG